MTLTDQQKQQRVERVLALVDNLKDRDGLRLDEIDAAFYWGVVHSAELDRVFGITEEMSGEDAVTRLFAETLTDEVLHDAFERVAGLEEITEDLRASDPIVADLADRLLAMQAGRGDAEYANAWASIQAFYPELRLWILRKRLPRFRAPWCTWWGTSTWWPQDGEVNEPTGIDKDGRRYIQSPGAVIIGIPNGELNGSDVAEVFQQFLDRLKESNDLERHPALPGTFSKIGIRTWFVPAGDELSSKFNTIPGFFFDDRLGREVKSALSQVIVEVSHPFPPSGLLAAFYDAIVIEEKGWHKSLQGKLNGQTPANAIRTWAIGLLNGSGAMLQADATNVICDLLDTEPVTRFPHDREILLERMRIPGLYEELTRKPWKSTAKKFAGYGLN